MDHTQTQRALATRQVAAMDFALNLMNLAIGWWEWLARPKNNSNLIQKPYTLLRWLWWWLVRLLFSVSSPSMFIMRCSFSSNVLFSFFVFHFCTQLISGVGIWHGWAWWKTFPCFRLSPLRCWECSRHWHRRPQSRSSPQYVLWYKIVNYDDDDC